MSSDYKKTYYSLLCLFSNGSVNTRSRLLRKYSEAVVDGAIALGLIKELYVNDEGNPVYGIEEDGRKLRDE